MRLFEINCLLRWGPDMNDLTEWLLGLGVLATTVLIATLARTLLRRVRNTGNGQWAWIGELAPALSNLIYIVGLRVFADTAPLSPKIAAWLDHCVYVLAVLIFLGLIRRAALLAVEWSTVRSSQSSTLQQGFIPMMKNVITLFVFFSGAIMILKHFGYDVMSLLTALGVGSLAVGLAAQPTLSNMISGFTLIIDRNLRPGDRISLAGSIGTVEEIGLRSTRIKLGDGNTLIVPNAELVNTRIMNLSMPSRETTCSTTIQVPYDVPFARIKDLCLEIVDQVEKANRGRGKWVNLAGLQGGYQTVQIGFWLVEMDDAGAAISDFNERLMKRLDQERIHLALPVQVPSV
jgi:small-conductance mechanosensitive channel